MCFGELTGREREPSAGPWQKTSFQQNVFWTLLMWTCCFVRSHLVSQSTLCASADGSRSSGIQNPESLSCPWGQGPGDPPGRVCWPWVPQLSPLWEWHNAGRGTKSPRSILHPAERQGQAGGMAWSTWDDGELPLLRSSHSPQLF